ncbi:hypothetical protein PF002_g33197, partial [Phytophthora fragariae]
MLQCCNAAILMYLILSAPVYEQTASMPPRPSLGRIIHRCSLRTSLVATFGPPCVCAPGFHCSSFSVESLPAYTRAHQIKPSGGFEPPPPASGTL